MRKHLTLFFISFLSFSNLIGQMVLNGDSLVGNEWINFDQSYYKFKVPTDGIYRITYEALIGAGIDLTSNSINDLDLIRLGRQVPIFISDAQSFGSNDYVEFYGYKNRGELDKSLYESEENILNPGYSLITDTATYFLTWNSNGEKSRIKSSENDLSGNLPEPASFYWHTESFNFSDAHFKPTEQGSNYIKYSTLVAGEGFSARITNDFKLNIPSDQVYQPGGNASLSLRFGVNKVNHNIELNLNGTKYHNYEFNPEYRVTNDVFTIPIGELADNNSFQLKGTLGNSDRVLVAQVDLTYPRKFNLGGSSLSVLKIPANNEDKLIELENFSSTGLPIIIDLQNNNRIIAQVENNKTHFKLDATTEDYHLIVYDPSLPENINSVQNIVPVTFIDFSKVDHDFLIISNKDLYANTQSNSENWVQAYADYRASTEGGGYNPIVVDVEQLYDQFSYGIARHFISINNFAYYAHKTWSSLDYFFVIGKGIEYPDYRRKNQQESILTAPFFVPVWGAPGSDNLLFARKGQNYAMVPVGRIAATNPEEVKIYYDKIKAFEKNNSLPQEIDEKFWTKKILHLSGGGNASEQRIISILLGRMEDIVETEKFGADVVTFRKSSADPLQTSTSQEIVDHIDNGVSLITFFGHSAVGTFDFSLEEPSKYQNSTRLPMILSLGCYSGNIFVPSKTKGLSEAFVLQPDVGAVAFAAASGTAYLSAQGELGRRYYNYFANELYGSSIGTALHELFVSLSEFQSIGYVTLLQQMTFHGDPSLSYIEHEGPDYIIDYSSIKTNPSIISTADAEYNISFNVVNIGSNVRDSIVLKIEHLLADGPVIDTLYQKIACPASRINTTITLKNLGIDGLGENRIRIFVDEDNHIKEYPTSIAESNNTIQNPDGQDYFAYYVLDNAAKPIYPSNFGIVNNQAVLLKASTSNLFTPVQNYLFQVDTSALFENPLEEGIVLSGGGVIEFDPSITLENDKVYYWRIAPEAENQVLGRLWNSSSFVYDESSQEGWNQSHYYQFLANENLGVNLRENRKFYFDDKVTIIEVINGIFDFDLTGYRVNLSDFAESIRPWNYQNQGISITVLDTLLATHTINSGGDYGSIRTGNRGGFRSFSFNTDTPENRKKIIDFITNHIPDGYYVTFFSILKSINANLFLEDWEADKGLYGTNLWEVLEQQGAESLELLKERGTVPYNFLFRKNRGKIDEAVGETISDIVTARMNVIGKQVTGSLKTIKIGPAQAWHSVENSFSDIDPSDSIKFNIFGVNENGQEELVSANIYGTSIDISDISVEKHPYLKLEFIGIDEKNRSVPNIDHWRVLYTPCPEYIFGNKNGITFRRDTLLQGEELFFSADIVNIGGDAQDSLLINFNVVDEDNQRLVFSNKYKNLESGKSQPVDFKQSTTNFLNTYQFSVELNPEPHTQEQFLFNNLGLKDFEVVSDNSNPILDITFDGIRIMNNDIIAANPEIIISLSDDNPFFLIDDPSLFEIKLDTGNISALVTISPDDPEIEFNAATSQNKEATIVYRPKLNDGSYVLHVQGKDASNNFSGENAYTVSFRVIDENSVSNVFNYPNPFSTRTQFVFTLTGSVPEVLKLQVLTVSGKVVREFTKDELGDLRVGVNRTDLWWDGTDEYGDKLANGVYLYRLIIPKNLEYESFSLEKNGSNPDSFFKKGFGKMVIMR